MIEREGAGLPGGASHYRIVTIVPDVLAHFFRKSLLLVCDWSLVLNLVV